MLSAFNANSLRAKLIKFDTDQQLAFGAICCERLLPNYIAFQQDVGWGDIAPIRKALDFVWSFLGSKSVDTQAVESITDSCESVAPDSEDFESLYVSSAQDACFAVFGLLDFLLENSVDKIVQAATYATDSVDLYVQEIEDMAPNDPELEQKILNHRLMQRELAQQEKDFTEIEQATTLSSDFLDGLKQSWNNEGKSNLDLP